jgi:hypothetical protein
MTLTRPEWTCPAVLTIDDLGGVGGLGDPLSRDNGEARLIAPLIDHPAFLAKLYKTPRGEDDATRLDRLVLLAEGSTSFAATLRSDTSWPVARIRSADHALTGCVIPRAPDRFRAGVRAGTTLVERYLDVDLLAKPAEVLRRRGLPVPTAQDRLTAARHLARVGAAMERLDLVYSDWSYSNAFWNSQDWSVFLIDVDGCAFHAAANICQPNWEDPLTPRTDLADTYVDRYRVALLVARCLTARRDRLQAARALTDGSVPASWSRATAEALLDVLLARQREYRPSLSTLQAVMDGGPYVFIPGRRAPLPSEPQITLVPQRPAVAVDAAGPNVKPPQRSAAPSTSPAPSAPGVPRPRSGAVDSSAVGTVIVLALLALLIIALVIANR